MCIGLLTRRLYAQQLPSSVCAHVLAPKPGERVLDMCAAPGGKVMKHIHVMTCFFFLLNL
jgi:16S rRNA C967 or C1407 C5-methylase (RsmB/RsmF family)